MHQRLRGQPHCCARVTALGITPQRRVSSWPPTVSSQFFTIVDLRIKKETGWTIRTDQEPSMAPASLLLFSEIGNCEQGKCTTMVRWTVRPPSSTGAFLDGCWRHCTGLGKPHSAWPTGTIGITVSKRRRRLAAVVGSANLSSRTQRITPSQCR